MLFAIGGELVDDFGATAAEWRVGSIGLGDPARAGELLQAGIERAVGEGAQRAERAAEAFAQLVAMHGRLVKQAENGELKHTAALAQLVLRR